MSTTHVRCYAGAHYPERPLAFEQEGGWLEIIELLRQTRTPEGRVFHVLAANGRRYKLTWAEADDCWSVKARARLE